MNDMNADSPLEDQAITDDDRLWAALAWLPITPLWPIVAILLLFMEDKKDRRFIRYHAILSLVTGVVATILTVFCVGIFVFLAMFYFALKAYQGEEIRIPVLTELAENQGWI